MTKPVKQVVLGVAGVVIGIPLLYLIAVMSWNHGSNLVNRVSGSSTVEGPTVMLPEPPLPGDDAFATVSRIAGQIDLATKEAMRIRNCLGESPPYQIDWGCTTFLETQAIPLRAFDEWLAGASPYKLERPSNLGRHSRFLMSEITVNAPLPSFMPFTYLSQLLAIRSLKMLQTGHVAEAERDLRTIFNLGSFQQQNPVLLSQMSGLAVHRRGLGLIVRHVSPDALGEGFDAMLPDLKKDIEMLRWIYDVDGLAVQDALENDKLEQVIWLHKVLGLYSKARTWQFYLGRQHDALAHLDGGRLGESFVVQKHPDCESEPEGLIQWIKWLPNANGRRIVCDLSLIGYSARFGQTMDRVEATRVVVAARRFKLKHGRWPTQQSDLIPRYLKEWPRSALNAQPIQWLDDKSGVKVLGLDGKSPCLDKSELCEFPFAPPQPVGTAGAGGAMEGGKALRPL